MNKAIQLLKQAIARHERHMNGTEATSEASQMKMMEEMQQALNALTGDSNKPESSKRKNHITNMKN